MKLSLAPVRLLPISDLARRWRESFAGPVTRSPGAPPDPNDDILEPLRRVTSGGAS